MKNSYIPEVFKAKIKKSIKFLNELFNLFLSIFFGIALITFNINDNSFIASTSSSTLNFFGALGSYSSSFIFYTFGMMGYGLVLFFFVISILNFTHQKFNYFFIRLLGHFISLILIPQSLIYWNFVFEFYGDLPSWGTLAVSLYKNYQSDILSYFFSTIGLFLFCLSIIYLIFLNYPRSI